MFHLLFNALKIIRQILCKKDRCQITTYSAITLQCSCQNISNLLDSVFWHGYCTITNCIKCWRSWKKSDFDGKVKSSKFKARKFRGTRRTYSTSQWFTRLNNLACLSTQWRKKDFTKSPLWYYKNLTGQGMQCNAEVGLFKKPSMLFI